MDYDLGYFDLETRVIEPLENPFAPKVSPMWPVHGVTHVSGPDPWNGGARGRIRTCDPCFKRIPGLSKWEHEWTASHAPAVSYRRVALSAHIPANCCHFDHCSRNPRRF